MNEISGRVPEALNREKVEEALPEGFYQISSLRSLGRILIAWIAVVLVVGVSEYLDDNMVYMAALISITWIILFLDETTHRAMHKTLFSQGNWHSSFQMLYSLPLFCALVPQKQAHQWSHEHYHLYADPDRAMSVHLGMPAGRHTPGRTFFFWIIAPFLGHSTLVELSRINRCLVYSAGYRRRVLSFWIVVLSSFTLFGALEILFWYWVVPLVFIAPIPLTWLKLSRHYLTTQPYYCRDIGRALSWLLFGGAVADYTAHMLYPSVPHYKLREVTERYLQEEPRIVATNFLQLTRQICGVNSEGAPSETTRKTAPS